ncbi:MAG: hypothetical protein KGR18_08780 [Acidobacteria bacterium]|nr:hypothetical protein [Acidobacteriota bacterium]
MVRLRRSVRRTALVGVLATAAVLLPSVQVGAAVPGPKIVGAAATAVTVAGAPSSITATLTYASTCSVSASPAALVGNGALPCSGSLSRAVWFPYNSTNQKITYAVTVEVKGSGGTKLVTKNVKVSPGAGGGPRHIVAGGWTNGGRSCAVDSGTGLRCWGMLNPTTAVANLTGVVQVDAGYSYGNYADLCALKSAGTVMCMGDNTHGQLGDGTWNPSGTPVAVTGLSGVTSISVGPAHACGVLGSGGVRCWGSDAWGELGDGSTYPWSAGGRNAPVTVQGITDAVAVAAGDGFTCALHSGGAVSCWGMGIHGELGDGLDANNSWNNMSLSPKAVASVSGAVAIAAGHREACAILRSGPVLCWGENADHDPNKSGGVDPSPYEVPGVAAAVAVSIGYSHACMAQGNGTVQCRGDNSVGQQGRTINEGPGPVVGLTDAVDIDAGDNHTCARRATGAYVCWGDQRFGQLGNSVYTGFAAHPVSVLGM